MQHESDKEEISRKLSEMTEKCQQTLLANGRLMEKVKLLSQADSNGQDGSSTTS